MALEWKIDKIADYKTLCWVDVEYEGEKGCRLNGTTETLIWTTMAIGLDLDVSHVPRTSPLRDPEKLIAEFTRRVRVYESNNWGISVEPLPEEAIRAHLGLSTNVGFLSRQGFAGRVKSRLSDEAKRRARKAAEDRKAG